MTANIERRIEEFAGFLPAIAELSPDRFDSEFHCRLADLEQSAYARGVHVADVIDACFERIGEQVDASDVLRLGRHKPLGYAGDFLCIDWIYTRRRSRSERGRLWDDFYHRQDAPRAVRNRKRMFEDRLRALVSRSGAQASVLNVACGPGREIRDALKGVGEAARGVTIHCVDVDRRALAYASRLNRDLEDLVDLRYFESNALRFSAPRTYSLVWSAGLFDYLEDRLAAALLRRMWRWTATGGSLVVGNFHKEHRSRRYIEWCGKWFLIHRDAADYRRIAARAGIPEDAVRFERDATGGMLLVEASK